MGHAYSLVMCTLHGRQNVQKTVVLLFIIIFLYAVSNRSPSSTALPISGKLYSHTCRSKCSNYIIL